MENLGIQGGFLAAQLFNLALLLSWVVLVVAALVRVGREPLTEGERLNWTLIILLLPMFGALAFLLTRPKHTAV